MAAKGLLNLDRVVTLEIKKTTALYSVDQEEPTDHISILLVDPLTFERAGLQMLINSQADLKLIGDVSDVVSVSEAIGATPPDIVVLALSETSQEQINGVREIAKVAPYSRIIVLMGSADTNLCVKAVKNGAIGVVLKTQSPETLLKAIRKVNVGEAWLDQTTVAALARLSRNQPAASSDEELLLLNHLTQIEHEIVKFVVQGLKARQIAKRLFLSESTIRHHMTIIYEKVGVSSQLELVIFAFHNGLDHCSN